MAQNIVILGSRRSGNSRWSAVALELRSWGGRTGWRLTRLPGAWIHHRRIRAELLALDEAQLRDAGITSDALTAAIRRPFRLDHGG